MKPSLIYPLPKCVAAGQFSFRWVILGLAGIFPSMVISRAESIQSPAGGAAAQAPLPAPALGFPVISPETGMPQGTPLPDVGLQPLPSDSGNSLDPVPFPEDLTIPVAALDSSAIAPESTAGPQPLPEPEPEPVKTPSSTDVFNSFGGFPPTNGGFGGNEAFGGRPSGFSGRPYGFGQLPNSFPLGGGLGETLLDGFSLSASLSGTYDTNPSLGYGAAEDSGAGDFFMTLGGNAAYRSRAAAWTFGVTYSGGYSEYFTQSELSGYNQSASGSINYERGPLSAALSVGVGFGSGANRYYESVVNEISYSYSLSANYRVSSKTSLTGSFSQSLSSASGGQSSDIGSFNLSGSAMWRYSPLTQFGPGIRYTRDSGETGQGRSSIGPTMTVNYKLSSKVSLNSMVGMDFAQYEDGETVDPSVVTTIALNYQASRLWGMNLSLNRSTQPDPGNGGQFNELTSLRVGYNRKIRRAAWNLGMSYEMNNSQAPTAIVGPVTEDRDYMSFDTSLGMPVFANTCNASLFLRYSDQGGGTVASGESIQTGFTISRSF